MAVNDPNYIGVRAELNAKGIDNSRIGYDKTTGFVTIDGQSFIKPTQNIKGTTYADPTAFGNAYSAFETAGKAKAAETNYMDAMNNPYTNPLDTQINDLLTKITGMTNNPDPYNVYADPGYAAYLAQSQRAGQAATRAAQESMGAAGFGRSTNLADRAQHIQNDQNEYMQLQVVPQLTSAHQAQEAQKLAGLMNLLNALSGQQGVYDTRHNSEVDRLGRTLEYLTGRSDRAQDISIDATRRAEDIAYREARDKVADEQYKKTFDENVRQFGLKYALEEAVAKNQMKNSDAQLAISRANAAASRENAKNDNNRAQSAADFERKMKIWQATGSAPDGIDGVAPGTKWGGNESTTFEQKMDIWRASGSAPEGIPGVKAGTKYGGEDPAKSQGIDDYDLAVIDTMVAQKGLNYKKMSPADARSFVGQLKGQYGWSTQEAQQVENYLLGKMKEATTKNEKPKDTTKKKQEKPPSSGKFLTPFPGIQ